MDLNSIDTVLLPRARGELPVWSRDTAFLGGGTWLFSEPQPTIRRLVDLTALGWERLLVDAAGLHIAATCTIAALSRFAAPADWPAADLIGQCCEALSGSFKVSNAATVGGNICLALPAAEPVSSISPDQFKEVCALVKPGKDEDKWANIPWQGSLWEARKLAAEKAARARS